MRQIFSVRFFAAVGAVAGLLFLLTTVFTARNVIDSAIDDGGPDPDVQPRAIDLVDVVTGSSNPAFQISPEGLAAADTQFVIDPTRQVTVVAGTPGVDHCGRVTEPGVCAIVADLLGEAWCGSRSCRWALVGRFRCRRSTPSTAGWRRW